MPIRPTTGPDTRKIRTLAALAATVLVTGLVTGISLNASATSGRLGTVGDTLEADADATEPAAEPAADPLAGPAAAAAPIGPGTCWQQFCDKYPPLPAADRRQSSQVSYDSNGRLRYAVDAEGNRIPDFSYAGYHYGGADLPADRRDAGAGQRRQHATHPGRARPDRQPHARRDRPPRRAAAGAGHVRNPRHGTGTAQRRGAAWLG